MKKKLLIFIPFLILISCPVFSQKNKPKIITIEENRYYEEPVSERESVIREIRSHKFAITDSLMEVYFYDFDKGSKKRLYDMDRYNRGGFLIEHREYKKNKLFNHYKLLYTDTINQGNVYLLDTLEGKKVKFSDTIFVNLKADKEDSIRLIYKKRKKPTLDLSDFSEIFKASLEEPIEREEIMDSIKVRMVQSYNGKNYYIVKRETRGDWLNLQYVNMHWPYPDFCIESRNDKKNYREIIRYNYDEDENGSLTGYHLYMKYFYYTLDGDCKVSEQQYYTDWDGEKHYSKPVRTIKAFKCNGYDEYMEIKGVGKITEHSMTVKKYFK